MKTNIKKIAYAAASGIMMAPLAALAAGYQKPSEQYGTFSGTVGDAIRIALQYILAAIATISIIGIVVGGLMYIISGGDDEKTKKAKGIIFASIVGLVVALLGYAIVVTLSNIFTGSGSSTF